MTTATTALDVRSVGKDFRIRRSVFAPARTLRAVDAVSFAVPAGRVLGIAGESGSGKSTLANMLVGLERPSMGEIRIGGRAMTAKPGRDLRRAVQMISQDPFGSINPRFTVRRTVQEPLIVHGIGNAEERRRRTVAALDAAELRPGDAYLERYPHELSGGQRQRVAIARATILAPKLLVADEPVSMLDVSVRAGILRLLRRLVVESWMAMVFITHDLSIVGSICDELAIMYRGSIVEHGITRDIVRRPAHPYTAALIAAVPVPDPRAAPAPLPEKLMSGAQLPPPAAGCRFQPRCRFAQPRCDSEPPQLDAIAPGREVACFFAREIAEDLAAKRAAPMAAGTAASANPDKAFQ